MMSRTIVVPAAVPSLRQSSKPCTPSHAAKNRASCVPAAVPSVFQSSAPVVPSSATKKIVDPTRVSSFAFMGFGL
jgi:hypothetical protein